MYEYYFNIVNVPYLFLFCFIPLMILKDVTSSCSHKQVLQSESSDPNQNAILAYSGVRSIRWPCPRILSKCEPDTIKFNILLHPNQIKHTQQYWHNMMYIYKTIFILSFQFFAKKRSISIKYAPETIWEINRQCKKRGKAASSCMMAYPEGEKKGEWVGVEFFLYSCWPVGNLRNWQIKCGSICIAYRHRSS